MTTGSIHQCCFPPCHEVCVFCRQHLTPCEAELTLSGHDGIKSNTSNYWVSHVTEGTNHVFTGGLPQHHLPNQVRL